MGDREAQVAAGFRRGAAFGAGFVPGLFHHFHVEGAAGAELGLGFGEVFLRARALGEDAAVGLRDFHAGECGEFADGGAGHAHHHRGDAAGEQAEGREEEERALDVDLDPAHLARGFRDADVLA